MIGNFLILTGVLAAAGILLILAASLLAGLMILRPPRMTDGKAALLLKRLSPGDLHLPFEEIFFPVRDPQTRRQIIHAAWWIPHPSPSDRCIILIHGYADAKVGSIAWAPLLHSLGWNILAVDLRAHGQSQGRHCTAGYYERHDLDQIINQLTALHPNQTRRLVLMGISLGAAVAAATVVLRENQEKSPPAPEPQIVGVILEGPFADFRRAIVAHSGLFGMPGGIVPRLGAQVAQWISGADFRQVRPAELIKQIVIPILVIHAEDDPLMDDNDERMLTESLKSRPDFDKKSFFWRVPDTGHVLAMATSPEEYSHRIKTFLESSKASI